MIFVSSCFCRSSKMFSHLLASSCSGSINCTFVSSSPEPLMANYDLERSPFQHKNHYVMILMLAHTQHRRGLHASNDVYQITSSPSSSSSSELDFQFIKYSTASLLSEQIALEIDLRFYCVRKKCHRMDSIGWKEQMKMGQRWSALIWGGNVFQQSHLKWNDLATKPLKQPQFVLVVPLFISDFHWSASEIKENCNICKTNISTHNRNT